VYSFTAPWDRRLCASTVLLSAAILAPVLILPAHTRWVWWIRGALLLLVGATWLWAPTGFRLQAGNLVVTRLIGELRISLSGLTRARRTGPDELRGAVRMWGSCGLFGCYGRFQVGFETQIWYVTDRSKCVRLELPGCVVVVSPSDPDAFLAGVGAAPHASE